MKKPSHTRRGAVLVYVLVSLLVLVGFVGLGTDVGWLVLSAQKLQTGADASSLAAAQLVKLDQDAARDAAIDVAGKNNAAGNPVGLDRNETNDPDGDIVIGRYDQIDNTFTPTLTSPNAVKVVARRVDGHSNTYDGVPLTFGRAFNVNTVNVERYAIAINGGGTGAGMIVLDPDAECSLDLSGNPTVNVSGGAVQVNSSANCAVCDNGTPELQAPTLNVYGTSCLESDTFGGDTNNGAPQIPDPLIDLPAPPDGTPRLSPPNNGDQELLPGHYANGINKSSGSITMAPGIYVVEGNGFQVNAANVTGDGVMIYIKDGPLDIQGNGNINLSPLNPVDNPEIPGSDTYEHVTIFQSRDNHTEAEINGTNNMNIEGTIYFPENHLELGGTGDGIGNQLIVNTMHIYGNGDITINYNGTFVAPGNRVFLVE